MNYKVFPDIYWQNIETALKDLKALQRPIFAAFDADGTLWDTDLGENFFNFEIDHKLVELPSDPWRHYLDLKKENNDPRSAYLWLAQINKGRSVAEVRKWAQSAFEEIQPNPIFVEQQKLITLLKSYDVQIFIVTASIKWAVEPGARALGLSIDNVVGVETSIVVGFVTDNANYPITYRTGKVEALLKRTGQHKPFLCSGNTIGDFELLESATHFKLAVSAASRDDKLFKNENELFQKAQELNWWSHRFI